MVRLRLCEGRLRCCHLLLGLRDAALRIQPPSTGEQVPANPPNTLAALVEAADKAREAEEAAKTAAATGDDPQKAMEQVPQNG